MSCTKCGGNHTGNNPLDCNTRFLACNNPCGTSPGNTAQCESLPSQIENFTLQFFGTVVKTEVDGRVTWSLPCGLDVGLPNNPRGVDEGLACYFIRLFMDGIIGLTGPKGKDGENGSPGKNTYSVVTKGFVQPTLGAPQVQVVTTANPAIFPGLYVAIESSGLYLVTETDGNGTLFLTLQSPVVSPPSFVNSGKLVVPAGSPGASVKGDKGDKGDKGETGPAAFPVTATNSFYSTAVGTDYNLGVVYTNIDFINSAPQVLLTTVGYYLVTVVADVQGLAGVATTDLVSLKLKNITNNGEIDGSEHSVSGLASGYRAQVTISVRVQTDNVNQAISLQGVCTSAGKVAVVALHTTITSVRIA